MNKKESGSIGGKKRWKNVSPEDRKKIMSDRAKQLWTKIKKGELYGG